MYLYLLSAKVRGEMPDIHIVRGHARLYHFSLLQIISYANYFTRMPSLLFLRPSGKRSNTTFLSNLFWYFTTIPLRKFLLIANPSLHTYVQSLVLVPVLRTFGEFYMLPDLILNYTYFFCFFSIFFWFFISSHIHL